MSFNIKHVAHLARLTLSEKEITKYYREIDNIVRYVDKLASVNVSQEEATMRLNKNDNRLRPDLVESWPLEEKENLINLAPRKKNKLIIVPRIFES
jgi:aspartyl-tRNA(Asn)/glutamyl-tRNA(Gln) amidotransferase subunit C